MAKNTTEIRKEPSPHKKASKTRPTIQLIADDLGVSVSTVSRVLNEKGSEYRIGLETQSRIKEAAKRLRFSPNRMARGLRLRSSETIGLVVPDIANPFFASIARGITEEARKHNYSLLLCDSQDQTDSEVKEIQLLQDRSVEGLIICPVGLSSEHLMQFESSYLATVVVDRYFPERKLPTVGCDNVASSHQAVSYLIEHGHRRIACLSGLAGTLSNEGRIAGYRQALEEHGIPFDEKLVLGDAFSQQSGYESALELMKQESKVTALFAISNQCALGALHAIAEAGKNVPDDFSIVTFDDIEGAEFMRTPLTAVVQPVAELGRMAAEVLFSHIKGNSTTETSPLLLPTKLIARNSVKTIA